MENVAEGREFVEIGGRRKHVLGYLQDFLFTPERARAPITRLSGGERNRLLLARLFAQPSNLLVMDEPTNDLDVETLELLEELLGDYPGTLLLVSHDRDFLDNVVTSTLVMEGNGRVGEYVGGYSDWLRQRPASSIAAHRGRGRQAGAPWPQPPHRQPAKRKLSYKDARELEQLPARIEALETRVAALTDADATIRRSTSATARRSPRTTRSWPRRRPNSTRPMRAGRNSTPDGCAERFSLHATRGAGVATPTAEACPMSVRPQTSLFDADLFGVGPQQLIEDAEGGVSYRPDFIDRGDSATLVRCACAMASRGRRSDGQCTTASSTCRGWSPPTASMIPDCRNR